MLLRSKLFLLSPAPHPTTARGRRTKRYAGAIKVLEVKAASQQALFIASLSQSKTSGSVCPKVHFSKTMTNTRFSLFYIEFVSCLHASSSFCVHFQAVCMREWLVICRTN